MTVSNFDWTDKDSVKWYVLLPTGHEGPYSLRQLSKLQSEKKIAGDVKIWAEGIDHPIPFEIVLEGKPEVQEVLPPDLPPVPTDDVPPVPYAALISEVADESTPESETKKSPRLSIWLGISGAVLLMLFFVFGSVVKNKETFTIHRQPKMTLQMHQRILKENSFDGWDKKIFFKEYLPLDQSHIWLVTSSFQNCDVEATFTSLKDRLLSLADEKVSFKSRGHLNRHLVEFSTFEFIQGNKIIPGLYELDVKATNCRWGSFTARAMNTFSGPDAEYVGRTKVVLYSKGPEEFNKILDRLVAKKNREAEKLNNLKELFWQDLQQKLETLQAITLQIEQHMLDFLDKKTAQFPKNVKIMIDSYTRKFGTFLTSFVTENEKYFKTVSPETGISAIRDYELMVRLTAKKIGYESMKEIEAFQGMKKAPDAKKIKDLKTKLKQKYGLLKREIGQKIIQVSEDRSR